MDFDFGFTLFRSVCVDFKEPTHPENASHEKSTIPRDRAEGAFMARPKKEKELCKDHRVTVRFKEIQYSIIEGYANQLGISVAEYIRRQAVHGKVEVRYPIVADLSQIQKLTDEFGAIGNNLNQIARYFNMGGLHSMAIKQEIQECIFELMKLRKAVLDMAGDFYGSSETPIEQKR